MRRFALVVLVVLAGAGAAAVWATDPFDAITVGDVAKAANRPDDRRAPQPAAGAPGILDVEIDDLAFPDLNRFGWRATGVRRDRVDGRSMTTVAYERGAKRLTYTLVSGADHADYGVPTLALQRERGRIEINVISGSTTLVGDGARQRLPVVFALKRRKRTVVVTAPAMTGRALRRLIRLATWRAGGRLTF